LTLLSLDDPTGVDKKTKFLVNGESYSSFPEETFGPKDRFTYVSNQQDDLGTWCAWSGTSTRNTSSAPWNRSRSTELFLVR
jgi:hypothetical protein